MAISLEVRWAVTPLSAPKPIRYCRSCSSTRPFVSSARVRLNANGRKLDAWLIYKCGACESTWNRPVVERQSANDVGPMQIEAMQQSATDWVRQVEFDLSTLKRHCDDIELPTDVAVSKPLPSAQVTAWSAISLAIHVAYPTGLRLDRFLASESSLSRSRLAQLHRAGCLQTGSDRNGLRKPLADDLAITLTSGCLLEPERDAILRAIYA